MTEEQRRFIASHEAGHMVICHILLKRKMIEASCANVEGAYGRIAYDITAEYIPTKSKCFNQIVLSYGGLAATNLYYPGLEGYGVRQDMKEAHDEATRYVMSYNWKINVLIKIRTIPKLYHIVRKLKQKIIRREIERTKKKAYQKAKKVLKKNEMMFTVLREALVREKELNGAKIEMLIKSVERNA